MGGQARIMPDDRKTVKLTELRAVGRKKENRISCDFFECGMNYQRGVCCGVKNGRFGV